MKSILFFAFLLSLAKSGIWISLGILVKNHMDALLTMIMRKPLPEELVQIDQKMAIQKIFRWIGICLIVVGVSMGMMALATWVTGNSMSSHNFNFKF